MYDKEATVMAKKGYKYFECNEELFDFLNYVSEFCSWECKQIMLMNLTNGNSINFSTKKYGNNCCKFVEVRPQIKTFINNNEIDNVRFNAQLSCPQNLLKELDKNIRYSTLLLNFVIYNSNKYFQCISVNLQEQEESFVNFEIYINNLYENGKVFI